MVSTRAAASTGRGTSTRTARSTRAGPRSRASDDDSGVVRSTVILALAPRDRCNLVVDIVRGDWETERRLVASGWSSDIVLAHVPDANAIPFDREHVGRQLGGPGVHFLASLAVIEDSSRLVERAKPLFLPFAFGDVATEHRESVRGGIRTDLEPRILF